MTRSRLTLLVLLAAAAAPAVADSVERRAPMSHGGTLEVSNVAGDVEIIGWSREEVRVEADLWEGVERLDFETDGSTTRIEVVLPQRRGSRPRGSSLEIRVPDSSRVDVTTVSADLEVENIRGRQRLQTVSGDVTTQVWSQYAEVRTISGDLDISGHGGELSLAIVSVSGDIDVSDVSGELRGETVSGDVDVEGGHFANVKMSAVSGDFSLRGRLEGGGRIDVETVNGDVLLELEELYDVEYDLETFNGDIAPLFGYRPKRKSQYAPGWALRITEGPGSSSVRVQTLNGDVEVVSDRDDGRPADVRRVLSAEPGDADTYRRERDGDDIGREMESMGETLREEIEAAMEELDRAFEEDDGG